MIGPQKRRLAAGTLSVSLSLSVLLLSILSEYTLVPSSKVNLDLALMLTPSGILNNLLLTEEHPLHHYYFTPTVRTGIFDRPVLGALILCISLQCLGLLMLAKRRRNS